MKIKEIRRILDKAFRSAREFFDYADVLYERVDKTEVKTIGSQTFITPLSVKARVQMRFLKGGKKVSLKVGEMDEDVLCQAVARAKGLWRTVRKPAKPVRLAPIPNPRRTVYAINPIYDLAEADPKKIINAVLSGVRGIADSFERKYTERGIKINPETWFYAQNEEKVIADTDGVFKRQTMPRTFLQVHTKLTRNTRNTPDSPSKSTQTKVRIADIKGLEAVLESTKTGWKLNPHARSEVRAWMQKAIDLLDGVSLSAEDVARMDHFVLDFNTLGVFIHEALGHNFEADSVKAGTSGVADHKGKPRGLVAAATVHIIDGPVVNINLEKPDMSTGFGTELIDDEGVQVKPKVLARNGKVEEFIHNRETAGYYNTESNGGAFSELGDQQVCRMSNTYMLPADPKIVRRNLDALIKDVKYGVILEGTLGGAVSKDGMSSSVQVGYLIEDGKITKTVNPSNFSGKSMYALRYVDGCTGNLRIDDVGFCGKAGQHRPVGDGGPTWTRIKTNPYIQLGIQGG
ncbi:TldD/PmbA family protein [candidate division WOR-3 bacterium]|nr:TldD/PmbA family protein [candidate division WOR-3 bacterium]